MKAFKTHQATFTLMCILPMAESTQLWKRIFIVIFGITIPISVLCGLGASLVYVSRYANVDLEGAVKTVFQIAAYVNVSYMIIIAFFKRSKIIKVFRTFQNIYDTSKSFVSDV